MPPVSRHCASRLFPLGLSGIPGNGFTKRRLRSSAVPGPTSQLCGSDSFGLPRSIGGVHSSGNCLQGFGGVVVSIVVATVAAEAMVGVMAAAEVATGPIQPGWLVSDFPLALPEWQPWCVRADKIIIGSVFQLQLQKCFNGSQDAESKSKYVL